MELKDYIYQYKHPIQKKPKVHVFGKELDSCEALSENKKRLIRDAFYEIGERHFQDAVERWNQSSSEYALYQTETEDGQRGLGQIKICNLVGSYDICERIPEEEFFQNYYRCVKIGSQKYVEIRVVAYVTSYDKHEIGSVIYFFSDGTVFLPDSIGEDRIAGMEEEKLGYQLARQCVERFS